MIAFVPAPPALSRTISARHTCFCGALRSLTRASNRRRSAGETVTVIPVRMRQTRTPQVRRESPTGFKCQIDPLATDLVSKASGLAGRLHPVLRASVGDLVRSMNCYYSNPVSYTHLTLPTNREV